MTKQRTKGNALRIGVDIDGVLIDHTKEILQKTRALGYSIASHQTHGVVLKKLLSPEDYKKLQRYIYGKKTLQAPAVRRALKGFKFLTKHAETYVISRRKTQKNPRMWFAKNIPYFAQKRIFFVKKDTDKNKVARRLALDAFLDDRLSVLTTLPSVRHRFLFDQNKVFTRIPKGIVAVGSWNEFSKKIKDLF